MLQHHEVEKAVCVCICIIICMYICCCLITKSSPILCGPMDCRPIGSFVHGIPQARILEWVAISFSGRSSSPRDQTLISCIGRRILYQQATGKPKNIYMNMYQFSPVTQSCPTLCDPMACSTPGLPVHHHSWSLLMFTESVMASNHLFLCHLLLLLPSIFPSIRVF